MNGGMGEWGNVALYPGCVGGERRPGIDCLRMRDHSQESIYIWRLGGMRHTEMC